MDHSLAGERVNQKGPLTALIISFLNSNTYIHTYIHTYISNADLGIRQRCTATHYLVDVFWGQLIKLIQVVSTLEFHEC